MSVVKHHSSQELNHLKGLIRTRKTNYIDVAKKIGMNSSTFSKKINGISTFDIEEAAKIGHALSIPVEELPTYFMPGY